MRPRRRWALATVGPLLALNASCTGAVTSAKPSPRVQAVSAPASSSIPLPPPSPTTTAPPPSTSVAPSVSASTPGSVSGTGLTYDYALDAQTTDTPDWACVRRWESGDTYTDYSGAYGFEGADYGQMTPADQDAFALRIFARNGDRFAGAWNDRCTEEYGLR